MGDETDPRAWIAHAEEDHTIAVSALRRKKPLTHAACFHAQQCAEKYMKAMLIAKKRPFAKVHDLIFLNAQCEEASIFLGMDLKQLDRLSSHAVRARYPGEDATVEEAREALEIAKAVRQFARRWLGV